MVPKLRSEVPEVISGDTVFPYFRYVYTDEINLNNFELVCDICYAAKK